MTKKWMFAILFAGLSNLAVADAPPMSFPARGELLYTTHCISCHNDQVYWRDKKLATDWASLKAEVHRWQDISGLGWSEDDVAGVARYLNVLHYRYPLPD